jgi:hypothetical protein
VAPVTLGGGHKVVVRSAYAARVLMIIICYVN